MRIAHLYLQDPTESSIFDAYYYNQFVQVAGWGQTSDGGAYLDTLQNVEVKIMDTATCRATYPDPVTLCIVQTGATNQVSQSFS